MRAATGSTSRREQSLRQPSRASTRRPSPGGAPGGRAQVPRDLSQDRHAEPPRNGLSVDTENSLPGGEVEPYETSARAIVPLARRLP